MPRFKRGEAHEGLLGAERQTGGGQNGMPLDFARRAAIFTLGSR